MKLYERFGGHGFHTTLITTFGVDFDAFENIVLTRLRGAGCFNTALLVDQGMLAHALDGAAALPAYAGRHYTVTGVGAGGVFHPKITLQLGRSVGRLIVASANMTSPGLAGNLELAGELEAARDQPGECRLLASAWAFLRRLQPAPYDEGLAYQIDWMHRRTAWLFDIEPASGPITLGDGKEAAWLASGENLGIGARFTELVEERPVRRLTVLSPYWDADLAALKFLIQELQPTETVVLIDAAKALFPGYAARDLPATSIYDLSEFAETRFVHAKAVIAETARADHILYGSANCTLAALGDRTGTGVNAEACLYRRLDPNSLLQQLKLAGLLQGKGPIAPAMLPAWSAEGELALADAGRRFPGRFECGFDKLSWRPPAGLVPSSVIELLDATGKVLPIELEALKTENTSMRQYRMRNATAKPGFARLRYIDGARSGVAVVTILAALREIVREARGRRAEMTAARLSSEDAEAELWLLEALNDLEAAQAADDTEDDPGTRRTRQSAAKAEPETEFRKLPYDEFIRGRRTRSDDDTERNSLAGSDVSLVRNFLNRILSISDSATEAPEGDVITGLDLGDETADAAGALEAGENPAPSVIPSARSVDEQHTKVERSKATRSQIVAAVTQFGKRIGEKAETGHIDVRDVLRLRAMLMILCAAGQPAANAGSTSLQVLALSEEEDGWPRLIGRVLFCFFGGGHPAIRKLSLSAVYD